MKLLTKDEYRSALKKAERPIYEYDMRFLYRYPTRPAEYVVLNAKSFMKAYQWALRTLRKRVGPSARGYRLVSLDTIGPLLPLKRVRK